MKPVVSTIIPLYNGSRFIRDAVRTALGQTYPSIEVIVVDDGSQDDSASIVASEFPAARLIRQENAGVSAARNAGVNAAQGEYVAFLDQDDYWLPNKIERQMKAIAQDPKIGLVHSEVTHFDEVRQMAVERFNQVRSDLLVGSCYDRLLLGNAIFNCSVLVRRDVVVQAGLFDGDICGNTVQDYDLWLRCARLTKFAYCSEHLAVYRLHPEQGMWNVKESHSQLIQMLERHTGRAEEVDSPALRSRFSELLYELAIEHLDDGEGERARMCLKRSLHLKWSARKAAIYATAFMPGFLLDWIRRSRSYLRRKLGKGVESQVPVWTGRVNNGV